VQFAQGVDDNRAYAIKFFLDEDSFYAEAALYVAVFPHLKQWLSRRAADALARINVLSEGEREGESEAAQTMQAAGAHFLPQVHPCSYSAYLIYLLAFHLYLKTDFHVLQEGCLLSCYYCRV
jgi:hypothetical protein